MVPIWVSSNKRVNVKKRVSISLLFFSFINAFLSCYSLYFHFLHHIFSFPSTNIYCSIRSYKELFWNVYIFKISIKRVEESFHFIYFSNNGMTVLLYSILKYSNNWMKYLFYFTLFHFILLCFVPLRSIIFHQFKHSLKDCMMCLTLIKWNYKT